PVPKLLVGGCDRGSWGEWPIASGVMIVGRGEVVGSGENGRKWGSRFTGEWREKGIV
nr:hypothetical protein [Tanacetum cinerariifolium]